MEPRPVNKPKQTPPPAASGSGVGWSQPGQTPPAPPPYVPPAPSPYAGGGGSLDASTARGAWYESNTADPIPPGDPSYTPGRALTPIDGGRGARLVGPLLALLVLALVVASVVWVVMRVFDGDDNGNSSAANGTPTTSALAAPTVAATSEATEASDEAAPKATEAPAIGTDTGEETATSEAAAEPEPTEPESDPSPTKAPSSARALLPTSNDVPDGFKRTEDGKRTQDLVVASFGDPDDANAKLVEWEWEENAYRTYEIPAESNPDPNTTTYINVSVHKFGSRSATAQALTYFADAVIQAQGLEEIDVDSLGDKSLALKGSPDGVNLVVLYVRTGSFLIRIGGSSPLGDPTDAVIAVAENILE